MSFSKTIYSEKVLVIPRKQWLLPKMTEKLLTWTFHIRLGIEKGGRTSHSGARGGGGQRGRGGLVVEHWTLEREVGG